MPSGEQGGAWGGCPAGLPHALTHGRTLSAAAFPPRSCPRLPLQPPQECGNLTRAGSAVPARGPAAGTSPPSPALGGQRGAGTPQPSTGWGTHRPGVGPAPSLQGWHLLTPKIGKEEQDPCRQDVPQETPTRAGWGREETLPPGLVPSHTSATPSSRRGTRVCTATRAHLAHRHRHTSSVCAHTVARPRWVLHPQPRSHTHVPTPRPWAQAPPPFPAPRAPPRPQFLFTVMEPPARPSRHRRGGVTGASLLPLSCLAPVLMGSRMRGITPRVQDHGSFWEQQQEILTGKRAGPCVASAWAGCHGAAVSAVWVPLPGTAGTPVLGCASIAGCSGWSRVSCPGGGLKEGSMPGVQVCHKESKEESSPGPDPLCRIPQRRATLRGARLSSSQHSTCGETEARAGEVTHLHCGL